MWTLLLLLPLWHLNLKIAFILKANWKLILILKVEFYTLLKLRTWQRKLSDTSKVTLLDVVCWWKDIQHITDVKNHQQTKADWRLTSFSIGVWYTVMLQLHLSQRCVPKKPSQGFYFFHVQTRRENVLVCYQNKVIFIEATNIFWNNII